MGLEILDFIVEDLNSICVFIWSFSWIRLEVPFLLFLGPIQNNKIQLQSLLEGTYLHFFGKIIWRQMSYMIFYSFLKYFPIVNLFHKYLLVFHWKYKFLFFLLNSKNSLIHYFINRRNFLIFYIICEMFKDQ